MKFKTRYISKNLIYPQSRKEFDDFSNQDLGDYEVNWQGNAYEVKGYISGSNGDKKISFLLYPQKEEDTQVHFKAQSSLPWEPFYIPVGLVVLFVILQLYFQLDDDLALIMLLVHFVFGILISWQKQRNYNALFRLVSRDFGFQAAK